MRIYAVQHDIIWESKKANHEIVDDMLARVAPAADSYVVLPELGDTGFSFNLDTIVDDRTLPWARTVARTYGVFLQVGCAERGADGRGRNCAYVLDPEGEVRMRYEKVHPFSFGREIEYFEGGDTLTVADCGGIKVAPTICYDLRFPELYRLAAGAGAEVLPLGASWPDARQEHWRALAIARAIENQAVVVAVNRTGRDPHLAYAGGSIIVDHYGQVLTEAGREPTVLEATIDIDALRRWRREFPALRDVRAEIAVERA